MNAPRNNKGKKLDARHREALRLFLREFFELFFPDLVPLLSFEKSHFLDRELIALFDNSDTNDVRRRSDSLILIEMKLSDSLERILIYWEQQSELKSGFDERMYHYHCGAYYKFRKPILSIAFFTDRARWSARFTHSFKMVIADYPVIDFNYRLIKPRRYKWREFLEKAKINPLAAAYLPLTDYPNEKRPWILAQALRLITSQVEDESKRAVLFSLAERSILLNAEERSKFIEIIGADPQFKKVKMLQSVAEHYQEFGFEQGFEQGLEKGMEQGMEQGRVQGESQGTLKTIRAFLENGVDWDLITRATGMTREEFERLSKENSPDNIEAGERHLMPPS